MTAPPETRYARNGTIHLAYQVLGSGPVSLVGVSSGPASHVDFMWMEPSAARWLRRLASFSRLMRPLPSPDRFLGTVLFVDVVGSTQLAATIGDSRFAELLVDFIQLLRRLGGLRGCQLAIEVTGVSATHEIYESRYGLATMPARASSGMLRA